MSADGSRESGGEMEEQVVTGLSSGLTTCKQKEKNIGVTQKHPEEENIYCGCFHHMHF